MRLRTPSFDLDVLATSEGFFERFPEFIGSIFDKLITYLFYMLGDVLAVLSEEFVFGDLPSAGSAFSQFNSFIDALVVFEHAPPASGAMKRDASVVLFAFHRTSLLSLAVLCKIIGSAGTQQEHSFESIDAGPLSDSRKSFSSFREKL